MTARKLISMVSVVAGVAAATIAAVVAMPPQIDVAAAPAVSDAPSPLPPSVPGSGARPTSPQARMCGSEALRGGPASAPAGAITVPAGDNSQVNWNQPGATFWFAPGTHTLGSTEFNQIIPATQSTFEGAPDAVLDGQGVNRYAFTQLATNVTVRYLTIQNFGGPGSNRDEGVVNHDGAPGWTIEYNTIQRNGGAGVFVGSNNAIRFNCLKENGQYGFSMHKPQQGSLNTIVFDHNEIVGNNTDDWEFKIAGCGCTGGGKFWDAHDVAVIRNWVHDNKSVGLWADTNDYNFLIAGNWIENNDAEAIFYEISYNAAIRDNVIIGNAVERGQSFAARNDNFPVAAIYLSEAGGDPRVASTLVGTKDLVISNNYLQDNWSGVTLWENADRFCNSPANTSAAYCTLNASFDQCREGVINGEPNFSNCRWKTQNVKVTGNDFRMNPAAVNNCDPRYCGRMAVLSNFGTFPTWSPYQGRTMQEAITFRQNNIWSDNRYAGRWAFIPFDTGRQIDSAAWQAAPYGQDLGSTF